MMRHGKNRQCLHDAILHSTAGAYVLIEVLNKDRAREVFNLLKSQSEMLGKNIHAVTKRVKIAWSKQDSIIQKL